MEIRKFAETDSASVKKLILSILQEEYPFDRKAYPDTDIENVAVNYGGPGDTFFVVENKGAIIATAGVKGDSRDTALLRRVFVKPSERKKGYASQLLKEAVKFAKDAGYKELVFRTTSKMTQAIALCQKHGFREAEKIDLGGFFIHKFSLKLST